MEQWYALYVFLYSYDDTREEGILIVRKVSRYKKNNLREDIT